MNTTKQLIDLLDLTQIDEHIFQGKSVSIGSRIVFGGQVLAQAINASYRTMTNDRYLHSLHSYFLEAGDLNLPIDYHVEIVRNGGSFSTRRVTAKQKDRTIFILAASFHKREEGFEHQAEMPSNLKQPEELLSWDEMLVKFDAMLPKSMKAFLSIERPIAFKPVRIPNVKEAKNLPPNEQIWFKLKGDVPTMELQLKHQLLTYISDYNILNAAFNPNAATHSFGNTRTASLDHSMWFFRDFDFNDWLLFSANSPNAFGARGLSQGNIFTRDGKLVASFAQEGLLRPML